jgi:RNA polymerase sigma-70 factor (ECF subfamily)
MKREHRGGILNDEQTLLERARRFNEEALAAIFDTYYVPLYRYIYHHVGHVETAEDLTARTFQRMLEQFNKGKGPKSHLKAWLYRVAHNLVVDESRRQKHRDHAPLDDSLPAGGTRPEEQAQHTILAEQARRALHHLSPKQRAVVILKYLMGMNNDEVAQTLAISTGAVKSLHQRGLAALRRNLLAAGVIEGGEL